MQVAHHGVAFVERWQLTQQLVALLFDLTPQIFHQDSTCRGWQKLPAACACAKRIETRTGRTIDVAQPAVVRGLAGTRQVIGARCRVCLFRIWG